MFIAIIGTRLAGKSTVEKYLTQQKGFIAVKLLEHAPEERVCHNWGSAWWNGTLHLTTTLWLLG